MAYTTRYDITLGVHSDPAANLLLLQVQEDGLRLLAVDPDRNPLLYRYIQFDNLAVEQDNPLVNWLMENRSWLQSWGALVVVHQGADAVIVPAPLFTEDTARELLELQYGDLFRGTTLTDTVPGRQDYISYRVPTGWFQALSDSNPQVRHRHFFSLWLAWLDKKPSDSENGQAFLLFETSRVAMAIRKQDWLLVQQYEFQVPEDISYFLLSALQQYQLSPETVQLVLDGWIDKDSALYLELYKYIRNISLVELPPSLKLDKALLQDLPEHYLTPLIQMATCVS